MAQNTNTDTVNKKSIYSDGTILKYMYNTDGIQDVVTEAPLRFCRHAYSGSTKNESAHLRWRVEVACGETGTKETRR